MTSTSMNWHLQGRGFEFCNCDFGCGCNFGGVPNSGDGSCHAFVGMSIVKGACGTLDLSGLKACALILWPKAIHEGNGKAVFIVEPGTTDQQVEALAQICTGKLGGLPWELLGPSFEVVGLEKAKIRIKDAGVKSQVHVEGLVSAVGDTFKNPVTGEDHHAAIELPDGFIWKRGDCGQGNVQAKAGPLSLELKGTNWIIYDFDWGNTQAAAA